MRRFEELPAGPDKVRPLSDAVADAVRPGMSLHFGFTHNRPAAALAEVLRQFRGTDPAFEMMMMFTAGPAVPLLSEGLVRRLVTTLLCEPYPAPGPCQPGRRALSDGAFEIEHWSVLSYVARLEAAARGLTSMPVRGLVGSSLADENRSRLRGPDEDGRLSVLPMTPDLSFVHAAAADRAGNVLLTPPYGEGAWGNLAAREGVVVTCERLLEPDEIRRHSWLRSLPSTRVRSVSVVPFGAHPAGLSSAGLPGVEAYGDDVAFYSAGRAAGRTPEEWEEWVEDWFAGPADRDEYLSRLGAERQLRLKGKARPDSWRGELLEALRTADLEAPPTRTEAMIVTSARVVAERTAERGHRAILSGLGAGNLAAWLAWPALREAGREVDLVAEVGMVGYVPRPCDPYLFNFRNLETCTGRADSAHALGVLVSGAGARSLGSLGAGQVDGRGAFNSTRLADGTLLVGSGGANDVASGADEVVLTLPAGRGRLVESLPYVTGPGRQVRAVVTDRGVFTKARGPEPLRLSRLVGPLVGGSREAHVRDLAARTGFSFEADADLPVEAAPTAAEVQRLRVLDPDRSFLGPLDP